MTLEDLLRELPATDRDAPIFPQRLLGAFRRKSISFCTGVTDESTVVYWFQSRSFTIDLRLPDAGATAVIARQGWIGDTLWDPDRAELSWAIATSYQPHNQWPEPARLQFIGNSVLEFAPSGAYVEDWRQQSSRGPLLGLRLLSLLDEETGREWPMDGGLILAGEHAAFAQSRKPAVNEALRGAADLGQALADGLVSEREIESYEVSVAIGGSIVTYGTRADRVGQEIAAGDFALRPDGAIVMTRVIDGAPCRMRFALDLHIPDFTFERQTDCSAAGRQWLAAEGGHLTRHARIAY